MKLKAKVGQRIIGRGLVQVKAARQLFFPSIAHSLRRRRPRKLLGFLANPALVAWPKAVAPSLWHPGNPNLFLLDVMGLNVGTRDEVPASGDQASPARLNLLKRDLCSKLPFIEL